MSTSTLLAHALARGTVVGDRYRVRHKIAEGAAASVYAGDDESTQGTVALKVFDPLRSADPVAQARFEREFEILSRLDHPGLARSLRLIRTEELEILVLELVDGETLADRLSRGDMTVPEATELITQLATTLSVCHEAGVIHRDLKPANIVLHPERGPVILDFGVAWVSSAMTLTRTGAVIGSPRYVAPETFETNDADERVDVYALGAILFEAVTGQPVRKADSMAELAAIDPSADPPSVRTHRPSVSDAFDRIVQRAIAHRPEERFATVLEFREALVNRAALSFRRLESKLPCGACRTPMIVDLPICPGRGRPTNWALERGPLAVQLLEVPDPERTADWLMGRHQDALEIRRGRLRSRLARAPFALIVGVSENTADALAAQARETGCLVQVIRCRALVGPAIKAPAATASEIMFVAVFHFIATMTFGVSISMLEQDLTTLFFVPPAVTVIGMMFVLRHVRRPVLKMPRKRRRTESQPSLLRVQAKLAKLISPRARALAAAAIARATPHLLDAPERDSDRDDEVLAALDDALHAAGDLDIHTAALKETSRAELRKQIIDADARGDTERLADLRIRQSALTTASIAYDLASRRALEACQRISSSR